VFEHRVVGSLAAPLDAFPGNPTHWLVWATSSRDGKQIDHVGRSLRTQNPRFELLNTLHPREHVAAIEAEIQKPEPDAGVPVEKRPISSRSFSTACGTRFRMS